MTSRKASLTSTRSVFAILLLTSAACAGGGDADRPIPTDVRELARQSLAQIDGELSLPGLQQPVEVVRDRWGIPHIYAQSTNDLFTAQGYVMAQDRLWQMELWRRHREGRLAEIFGPKAVDYDRQARMLKYRGPTDDREWASYHPDGKAIFTAYANGVNAFITQRAENLPVEFKLTGIKPEPWTAETVILRTVGFDVQGGVARGDAVGEIQLAMDVARFGVAEANRRFAPDPWDALSVPAGLDVKIIGRDIVDRMRAGDRDPFAEGSLPRLEIVEAYRAMASAPAAAWRPPSAPFRDLGSNNWVVSGALSTTGKPVVANDPHRPVSNPSLRYIVHLSAPGWNVIGATEPPYIGVEVGHNERMAWGFTFAGADQHDVYVEELNPADPTQVRWNGGWEALRVVREEIRVKGEQPQTVELKFSRHGPVFYEDAANHRAYALRSAMDEPGTAAYLGSLRISQTANCREFLDAARFWKAPSHSLICGDVDGNIAWQAAALTPDRKGWSGRLPVPGTGQYEWQGFRSDVPTELNPERGFVATANHNINPKGFTRPVMFLTSAGVEFSRITRLLDLLKSDRKYSLDDHRRMQLDAYSLRAAADIPVFRGWTARDPAVEKARALVAEWDAVLAKESTAGAIWTTWRRAAEPKTFDPKTPRAERRGLVEAALKKALDQMTAEVGTDWTQWTYGRVHKIDFSHWLLPAFDLPAVERGGGGGTVAADGASYRQIMDVSDWDRSLATNTPGQSAQPESPFYANLLPLWANNEYFPLVYTRKSVDDQAARRLTLRPSGAVSTQ
jgi:penicillin amidase